MKPQQRKIKFEDGTERSIELVDVSDNHRKFLEEKTALIYGRGDFLSQTVGVIKSWMFMHGPDDEFSDQVVTAATLVIAQGVSEKTGGYVARANDNGECFVYVPAANEHYVVLISKIIHKIIGGEGFNDEEEVVKVKTVGTKITTDELREKLKEAVLTEDYALAAILRDKLNKTKS